MGQFDGLLPRLQYGGGPTNLDFTVPPLRQETFTRAATLERWAPEADISSATEYVANHIYMFDFVSIPVQHISDTELDDFYTWFNVIRDGQTFTYFPDKDVGGTSNTVIWSFQDNATFKPERRDSLWYFTLVFRIIS